MYSRNSTREICTQGTKLKKQDSRNGTRKTVQTGREEQDQLALAEYVSLEHPTAGRHWHSALNKYTNTQIQIQEYTY